MISLMPRSPPTCLFNKARDHQHYDLPMTSRSQWVSDAAPFDSLPDRVQQHVVIEWLRQEFDSARLHGLHRHEYIPMARNEDDRHVGRSPATRFCRSRPSRPGRDTSRTRQLGTRARGCVRNSCADANVSGCQPSQRISNSSDSRTETSSSTTKTIGVAGVAGNIGK